MEKQTINDAADHFSEELSNFLNTQDSESIKKLCENSTSPEILDTISWKVLPLVFNNLTEEISISKPDFFSACEKILEIFAEKCNPSEIALFILEQCAGNAEGCTKFCSVLKPLATALVRGDLSKTIDWVVGGVRAEISSLPVPENINPENAAPGEIEEAEDEISDALIAISKFSQKVVDHSIQTYEISTPDGFRVNRNLLSLHLNMFDRPFAHMWIDFVGDDEKNGNKPEIQEEPSEIQIKKLKVEEEKSKTSTEKSSFALKKNQVYRSILLQVLKLQPNPLEMLEIIENRIYNRTIPLNPEISDKNDRHNLIIQLLHNEVTTLAYANFFYAIFSSDLHQSLPQVYSPQYLMICMIFMANELLKKLEYVLVFRGLTLAEVILRRVDEESLELENLEIPVIEDFFRNLSLVMIYCDSSNERQLGLKVFNGFMEKFTLRAKYRVILHLYESCNHSGLLGLVIGILKSTIITCLKRKEEKSPLASDDFLGRKLKVILRKIFKLPNGSTSDLIELSDEIIAALNLLRFLLLRDVERVTGIWELMQELRKGYLEELRHGVELARAHWKAKVKDLEMGKETKEEKVDVDVVVGGQSIQGVDRQGKIRVCYQAINTLDVMESVHSRVWEIVMETQGKMLEADGVRGLWTSRSLLKDQGEQTDTKAEKNEEATTSLGAKQETEEEYEKNIKSQILSAAVPFVHEHGWSQDAISAGAESIGYPGVIHGLFPRGGADLVLHFYSTCNAELNKILKAEVEAVQKPPTTEGAPPKVSKAPEVFVRDALEKRLRMVVPYKATWPQALGLLALPPNVPPALANLLTLVDDICYYAGDRSVDFHWYTRRVAVAGIYKTTELYMLQDQSEDHNQTWGFLERRVEDAVQLNRVINVDLPPPDQALKQATDAATAAFTTARNILGMNWNR